MVLAKGHSDSPHGQLCCEGDGNIIFSEPRLRAGDRNCPGSERSEVSGDDCLIDRCGLFFGSNWVSFSEFLILDSLFTRLGSKETHSLAPHFHFGNHFSPLPFYQGRLPSSPTRDLVFRRFYDLLLSVVAPHLKI